LFKLEILHSNCPTAFRLFQVSTSTYGFYKEKLHAMGIWHSVYGLFRNSGAQGATCKLYIEETKQLIFSFSNKNTKFICSFIASNQI